MTAGQGFVKLIGRLGSAIFLFAFVVYLVYCFTSGLRIPVKGYSKPNTSDYYSQSADTREQLKAELETNLLPKVSGVVGCKIAGDKIKITIDSQNYTKTRKAIIYYYDLNLFEFVEENAK